MSKVDKMTKARADLVLANPFFGVLALRMKMIESDQVPTACTDGAHIMYNPKFVNDLSHGKIKGLLAHEILHCAMLHHSRRNSRTPQKWNQACDYVINPICTEAGFELPDGGLNNPAYKDKTADEVYNLLPEPPDGQGWGAQEPGMGDVSDAPGGAGAQQTSEAEWKIAVAQAAQVAKQMGKLPANLQRFVDEFLNPQVPWKDILRRFITERSKDDYSWARPNRRHIAAGLYLPTAWSESMGPVVIGVDTSGSIGQKELNTFSSEINAIIQDARPSRTHVVYCDARVNHVDEFEPNEDVVLAPHGGGGTDFRPVFDYVEKEGIEPKCLVYLTDLYGTFPEPQSYPVLWVSTTELQAPFGETLGITL